MAYKQQEYIPVIYTPWYSVESLVAVACFLPGSG